MPELIARVAQLRSVLARRRPAGASVGLVPTMGALHAGHRRLLDRARTENDAVVASIFVNPPQFDRAQDLERYPRTLDADLVLCEQAGVTLVFAPPPEEMYPREQLAWVDVPLLGRHLCGPHRPGHFRAVATVVMKLLQIVQPDRAYFGEKDAQQLAIIRRMAEDLNLPVAIVPVTTLREADGLAISSRNRHLSCEERRRATLLPQALFRAQTLVEAGERSVRALLAALAPVLTPGSAQDSEIHFEYFSFVDPRTLAPVEIIDGPVLVAAALWVGSTRLIDNVMAVAK